MSTIPSSTAERRRKPETVRRHALEVARRLLVAEGPGAVTLKAIGAELGTLYAALEARGLGAGTPSARRLFS